MQGVRVRGAGGLLVGVCVQPIVEVLNYSAYSGGPDFVDAFRQVFWVPEGADLPADRMAFIALRGLLVFAGLVLGVLGVAGLRAVRFPMAAVASLLALGALAWVIWPADPRGFDLPPDWVLEHPLWFYSARGAATGCP